MNALALKSILLALVAAHCPNYAGLSDYSQDRMVLSSGELTDSQMGVTFGQGAPWPVMEKTKEERARDLEIQAHHLKEEARAEMKCAKLEMNLRTALYRK